MNKGSDTRAFTEEIYDMKNRLTAIVFILIIASSGIARAAKSEFRALWVHNWRPGILCDAQVDQTVRWAKDCNINALVVQVRRVGDAYYDSAYEPRANNIEAGSDFDPLGCVIKKSKSSGMEVHAWFNVYRIGAKTGLPPMPNHVGAVHPEWLSKDDKGALYSEEGLFLDPGVPAVREHIVKIVADLVGKYDVDGVMLDYIRYPGKNWGYNDIAVAE
ncbi:MAG TPA: family 10 glycosylhydrolase, partial [Armatimonadota bacterium]